MARYVLVNRLSGKRTAATRLATQTSVDQALASLKGAKIISEHRPSDDRHRHVIVLEADPAEVAARKRRFPKDVIIEPVKTRRVRRAPPIIDLGTAERSEPLVVKAAKRSYRVTVTGDGKPIADCLVYFFLRKRGGRLRVAAGRTNSKGRARQKLPSGYRVRYVRAVPHCGYWGVVAEAPESGGSVDCPPLPRAGAGGHAWWHAMMAADLARGARGRGIKVGVIDSGCGPHRNLRHVKLVGAFVDGKRLPAKEARDVHGHGTHTTGIIGARPSRPGDYAGIARDCELFHARVALDTPDIVRAIDALSRDYRCDIINISLGDSEPSEIETEAIRLALERGSLCVCAAGNRGKRGSLDYPAALPDCVAVSAVGHVEWAPEGTWAQSHRLHRKAHQGKHGLFFSATSSFAKSVTCTAPGVGIISTVPDRPPLRARYMEMSGTSMATPATAALLALILSASPGYRRLPRGLARAKLARKLLERYCRPVGLQKRFQGRGLPSLRALKTPTRRRAASSDARRRRPGAPSRRRKSA